MVSSCSARSTGTRQESDLKQGNGIRWSYTAETRQPAIRAEIRCCIAKLLHFIDEKVVLQYSVFSPKCSKQSLWGLNQYLGKKREKNVRRFFRRAVCRSDRMHVRSCVRAHSCFILIFLFLMEFLAIFEKV